MTSTLCTALNFKLTDSKDACEFLFWGRNSKWIYKSVIQIGDRLAHQAVSAATPLCCLPSWRLLSNREHVSILGQSTWSSKKILSNSAAIFRVMTYLLGHDSFAKRLPHPNWFCHVHLHGGQGQDCGPQVSLPCHGDEVESPYWE